MKRFLAIIICIVMLAGCGVVENPKVNKTDAEMKIVSAEPSNSQMLPFLDKISADEVEKILYFDDSQPPDYPADTYYAFEEVDKIFEMFGGITLAGEIDESSTSAPGDYCGYKIYMKDGSAYTVWRSGKVLSCGGKTYEYTGDFYRQLHIGEVTIYAAGSNGYPADGKIKLTIKAFEEENTFIADDPVLKQLIGTKWTLVKPAQPHSGAKRDHPEFCVNLR
jgi:hypothetical protein